MDLHLIVTVGGQIIAAVVIIATIRSDVKWLKRWTREHEKRDEKNFETVNGRLGRLEDHLLR